MTCSPVNAEHHTRACIVLHNFLISHDKKNYSGQYGDYFKSSGSLVEGGWRSDDTSFFRDLAPKAGMNYSNEAKEVRNSFKNYFNSAEGSVPWQDAIVDYVGYDETA